MAVRSAAIDASFRAVTVPARQFPDGIEAVRVLDEPVELLTGPAHEFAAAGAVTPAEPAGHPIWMPGLVAGTEWAAYYDELAAAFGLSIDPTGPHFGTEPLLDVLAGAPALTTLRSYLSRRQPIRRDAGTWAPAWAQRWAGAGSGTRRPGAF